MAIYALLAWVIVRVVRVAVDRPSARTSTRSVTERSSDGSMAGTGVERTTHTIRRD